MDAWMDGSGMDETPREWERGRERVPLVGVWVAEYGELIVVVGLRRGLLVCLSFSFVLFFHFV